MTSLSTFCLEEHKGSPKSSTTAKAAQKGSSTLSSSMSSCWQQEAVPVFSLPVPSSRSPQPQNTGNDFHSSAPSLRLPQPEDSQLCTNMLGKGNADFLLQFHLLFWRMDHRVPSQPHRKGTSATPNSCPPS